MGFKDHKNEQNASDDEASAATTNSPVWALGRTWPPLWAEAGGEQTRTSDHTCGGADVSMPWE